MAISESQFIKSMAIRESVNTCCKMINQQHCSLGELIHPLTFSKDNKKYPGMNAIYAGYKFQRKKPLIELYQELTKKHPSNISL